MIVTVMKQSKPKKLAFFPLSKSSPKKSFCVNGGRYVKSISFEIWNQKTSPFGAVGYTSISLSRKEISETFVRFS